jgi:hypothetical protein
MYEVEMSESLFASLPKFNVPRQKTSISPPHMSLYVYAESSRNSRVEVNYNFVGLGSSLLETQNGISHS